MNAMYRKEARDECDFHFISKKQKSCFPIFCLYWNLETRFSVAIEVVCQNIADCISFLFSISITRHSAVANVLQYTIKWH